MAKFFISMLTVLFALALIACSGEKKAETKTETETDLQTAAVDSTNLATCPGCGMTMDKEKMITYVDDGDTTYFCSEGCRDNYLANLEAEEGETDKETETE